MSAAGHDGRADRGGLTADLARAGVGEHSRTGLSDRVGELYVMLTWRCNLRCRMCPLWGHRGICHTEGEGEERLTVEAVERWVTDMGSAGPRSVTLSGGEPLLSDLWAPLAHRLAVRGINVMLTTNATLLEQVSEEDLAPLSQINVSLDGPATVLERLERGGGNTLEAALAGVRHVLAHRRGGRPRLKLLAVITPEGVGHLEQLLAHFDDEGIAFDGLLFQHPMFLDPATAAHQTAVLDELLGTGVPFWSSLVGEPGQADVPTLLEELRRIASRSERVVVSPELAPDETRRFHASGSWVPRRYGGHCVSPWLDLGITPSGDVWICPGHPVGNVSTDDFAAVWNGARARGLRRAILERGSFPGCRACFYLYNYRQSL